MNQNILRQLVLCWVIAIAGHAAHAGPLIDNGHYTTDTSSGLDWLDMSYTRGQSYDQITQRLAGGDLAGWRLATSAEFDALVNHAIGGVYTPYFSFSQFDAMVGLVGLLGQTYGYTYYAYTVGFVDSTGLPMGDARQFGYHDDAGGYVRAANDYAWDAGFSVNHVYRGAFVVRQSAVAVPEPPLLALHGVALIALTLCRRRARS